MMMMLFSLFTASFLSAQSNPQALNQYSTYGSPITAKIEASCSGSNKCASREPSSKEAPKPATAEKKDAPKNK